MARNRLLWNFIATIAGLGIMVPTSILVNTGNAGTLGVIAAAVFIGGGVLGFLGYKKDGLKIGGAISGVLLILGIVLGVLIMSGVDVVNFVPENIGELIAGALLSIIAVIVLILVGLIVIAGFIVAAILFTVGALIGSLIGDGVWRDKAEEELEIAESYQPSDASQAAYEPVQQPAKQAGEVFCTNCGATNVAEDEFCTSCGSKLKK